MKNAGRAVAAIGAAVAVAAAMAVAAAGTAACGREDPRARAGTTVRDSAGEPNERGTGARYSRIISLVPAVTETLFAIGAGERVVGVSSFDNFPPEVEKLPEVGALLDPDIERIATLRPDLVIVYATQAELRAQLESMGIPVYEYRHAGLDDVMRTIVELGSLLGLSGNAEALRSRLEARLDAVRASVSGLDHPRTLLVFGRNPGGVGGVLASGGDGFLADLLEVAGAENVFGAVRRESLPATTEAVLASAPEVIVELLPHGSGVELQRQAEDAWRLAPALPAVRDGRVRVLVGDEFVVPGPRVADAADALARAIHGKSRSQ